MSKRVFGLVLGGVAGELDGALDHAHDLGVDRRQLVVGEAKPRPQLLERILRLPQLLLLALRPVDLRIADVVADEPERLREQEHRPRALPGVRERPLRRRVDGLDVLPVDRHRAHPEGDGALREVRDGQLLVRGRRLRIVVVLADEERRQLPQLGEVERLVERPDVRRAVAEVRDGHARLASHLECERRAGDHRQAAADDGVRAEVAALDVVEVHRASVATRDALHLPVELRHDRVRVRPARERMPVGAMRRREDVPLGHRARHADGHRLLADRHVQEARQLARAELLLDLLLEAADEQHLAVELPQAFLREPALPRCTGLGHGLSLCCGRGPSRAVGRDSC